MKWQFTYLLTIWFYVTNAQLKTDSVHVLPEVEKVATSTAVIKRIVYHSTSQTKNLTDALRENTGIYLKNYGNGQLASVSYRGTNASQTDVLWNGIKLNSPSLGQVDFSLFNIGMLEQLEVRGISQGGNVGGEMNIQNTMSFDSSVSTDVLLSYGSFNTFRGFGKLQLNNKKFYGATRISYLSADNNYTFINSYKSGNLSEKLTNAKVQLLSFMHQLGAKINEDNTVLFNLWLSDAQRQIPPVVSKDENKERQNDYSLRSMFIWKGRFKKLKTEFSSAFIHDVIHYINPEIFMDEKSTLQAWRSNFRFAIDSLRKFSVQLEAGYDFERAMVPSYQVTRTRNIVKLMAGVKYKPLKELFIQLTLREHLNNTSFSPFSPSLTVDFLKYFHRHGLGVTVIAARNFRFATLNDLYWVPGGNSNLKNEKSWDAEIGARYGYGSLFQFKAVGFAKYITDWIQWIPNGSIWQPLNVNRVLSRGTEVTITGSYDEHYFNLQSRVAYTYTRTTNLNAISPYDRSKNKQVIYVPQHVATVLLRLEYKKFFLRIVNTYTSSVFITTDNSQSLNGYYLLDAEIGKDFSFSNNYEIGISFRVNNITDAQYQNVAQRPMPGRNFEGTLRFNLQK